MDIEIETWEMRLKYVVSRNELHESIYYAIICIDNDALRAHYITIVKICANITSISLQNVGNIYYIFHPTRKKKHYCWNPLKENSE